MNILPFTAETMDKMGYPEHSNDPDKVMLSSEYIPKKEDTLMQHSAYVPQGKHNWKMEVKCRRKNNNKWYDVAKLCRNAKVLMKHNDVQLQLGSPRSDVVVAAFGCPGNGDGKRMQLAAFGKSVSSGNRVQVNAYLLDDTSPAFQVSSLSKQQNEHFKIYFLRYHLQYNISHHASLTCFPAPM